MRDEAAEKFWCACPGGRTVHTEKKLHNTQTALGAEKKISHKGKHARKECHKKRRHIGKESGIEGKVSRKENMLKKTRVKKNDVGKAETKLKRNMLSKFSCWRK